MGCYLFRFLDGEGKPTGFVGMASARDKKELFWLIDEFGDPNYVQIKKRKRLAACWCVVSDDQGDTVDLTELELGEDCAILEPEWKDPKWDDAN